MTIVNSGLKGLSGRLARVLVGDPKRDQRNAARYRQLEGRSPSAWLTQSMTHHVWSTLSGLSHYWQR